MTFDDKPDPDDLDELASAVLDDEATEAERDQVASDPRLTAREQEFRAVADRVGQVPPADAAARESILAAVLAAGAAGGTPGSASGSTGDDTGDTGEAAGSSEVVPLARRSPPRSRRFLPAVAAVVIVLLAIPAVLIALNRDSGINDVALSSGDSATSSESAGSTAGPTTTGTPTSTTVPSASGLNQQSHGTDSADAGPVADLGTLSSSDELGGAVKARLAQPEPATGAPRSVTTTVPVPTGAPSTTTTMPDAWSTAAPPVDCEPAIRTAVSGLGDLVLRAKATYRDAPAQVYGFDDPASGTTTVVVTDASTCAIVEQIGA